MNPGLEPILSDLEKLFLLSDERNSKNLGEKAKIIKANSVIKKYGLTEDITDEAQSKDGCWARTPWVRPPIR